MVVRDQAGEYQNGESEEDECGNERTAFNNDLSAQHSKNHCQSGNTVVHGRCQKTKTAKACAAEFFRYDEYSVNFENRRISSEIREKTC